MKSHASGCARLPGSYAMVESFVILVGTGCVILIIIQGRLLEGPICWSLRSITRSHDPICMEFKSCLLRVVQVVDVSMSHGGCDLLTVPGLGLPLSATLTGVCGAV